ncbi:MAG: AMP-binding protein, partial [Gammaproteobacteria bacterium]|nr:AMP-binding protein [Gammaproteobacteria bacterium]
MILNHFSEIVRKFPNDIAICVGQHKITYYHLNKRANQFANYLLKKHAKKNDIILINLEPDIDFFICVLGIVKIGAAYLPISKKYPQHFIKQMMQNVNSSYLISRNVTLEHYENSIHIIDIAQHKKEIYTSSIHLLHPTLCSNTIACLFFTSGSTGQPKCVPIFHESIVNLVTNTNYVFINRG